MQKEITLNQLMSVIDGEPSKKMLVLVDGTSRVETFLTYKGQVLDINKLSLKQKLNQVSTDELDKEIRHRIVYHFRLGEKVAFFMDQAISLNLVEFLGQFKWFDKSTFFNMANLLTRDYYVKHDMIKKEEDKDNFGNQGFWEPKEQSRLIVVINAKPEEFDKVKLVYPDEFFEFILVK